MSDYDDYCYECKVNGSEDNCNECPFNEGLNVKNTENSLKNGCVNQDSVLARWIPVEKGLPKETGDYLVTFRETGEFIDGEFIDVKILEYLPNVHLWVDYFDNAYDVIAWMPLPDPYRKE